jgi:hypothetical protein
VVVKPARTKKNFEIFLHAKKKARWRGPTGVWGGGVASLLFFCGLLGLPEGFRSRRALAARLTHFLFRACLDPFPLGVNVFVKTHHDLLDLVPLHFQRFRDNRSGLFGFFAAFGDRFICPALRAQ